jgi:hypothetical protein
LQCPEFFGYRSAFLSNTLYNLLAFEPVPAIQDVVIDGYFKRLGLFEMRQFITIADTQRLIPVHNVRVTVFFIAAQPPDQNKQLRLLQAQFLIKVL